MRALIAATLVLLAIVVACGGSDGDESNDGADSTPSSGTVTLTIENADGERQGLSVELAHTPQQRARGLMDREELAEDAGMLFVFESDTTSAFWMKDTLIPLSIAYILKDGTILDIQDMQPLSTDLHEPPSPYLYALEVNQGWYDEHGIGVGDSVEITDAVSEAAN